MCDKKSRGACIKVFFSSVAVRLFLCVFFRTPQGEIAFIRQNKNTEYDFGGMWGSRRSDDKQNKNCFF